MQCEEFEDRLNEVLDVRGRAECDAELRLHAESCGECRRTLEAYNAMLDGVCALSAPAAPAEMAERVLAELPVRSASRRSVALTGAALATAAGLLIAVVPLWQTNQQQANQGQANQQQARQGEPVAQLASKPTLQSIVSVAQRAGMSEHSPAEAAALMATASLPILQSLPAMVEDPQGDPYGQLLKETGHGLAAIVLYVPGIGGTRGIIDAESDPGSDDSAWAGRMSDGLKPVTDSVTSTLNLLWESLPVTDLATRS